MLAAQCVCAILKTEHSVIRQTLSTIADSMQSESWCVPGDSFERLKGIVRFLRLFDDACHSPKDRQLGLPMRGKSAQADQLILALEESHQQHGELLYQMLTMLHAIKCGETSQVNKFERSLKKCQASMLQQMDIEETQLHPLARLLLSEEEWAQIASAISCVPYAIGSLYKLASPGGPAPISHRHGVIEKRSVATPSSKLKRRLINGRNQELQPF